MIRVMQKKNRSEKGLGSGMGMSCNYELDCKEVITKKVTLKQRPVGGDRESSVISN
jgi:hypothetical protein